MKKSILLFIFILNLFCFDVWGQSSNIIHSPNKTDDKGIRQGQWTVLMNERFIPISDSSKARFFRIINYENGKPKGKVIDYYLSGGKQMEGVLISENPEIFDGTVTFYYENGQMQSVGNYINGKPEGEMKFWKKDGKPDIINERINTANTLLMNRNYLDAEPVLKENIKLIKEEEGEFSVNYIGTLSNLAMVYVELGQYDLAEPLLKESINNAKKKLGEEDPQYSLDLTNLAYLYEKTGKYELSEPLFRQSLDIQKKLNGEANTEYASSLNSLGVLYHKMGRWELAETSYKRAYNIYKNLNPNNPQLGTCLNNIASLYFSTGRYDSAEKVFKEALELNKKRYGENHLYVAHSLNNLASLYDRTGKFALAKELFKKVIEIRKAKLGPEHPDVASSLNNLASVYYRTGKYDLAEPLYKEAINIIKKKLGDSHPYYASSINSLGMMYGDMGNYEAAEPYILESYNKTMELVYRYFPYLSEDGKLSFWNTQKSKINGFNSFFTRYSEKKPEVLGKMYDITIATKGIILNSTQKTMKNLRNIRRKYDTWQNTRQLWLQLVQNPVKAKRLKINTDSLAKIADDMESELSKESAEFKRNFDTTKTKWQDIRNILEPNEASIEITRVESGKVDSLECFYAILIIKKNSVQPELVLIKNGKDLEDKYILEYKNLVEEQRQKIYSSVEGNPKLGELYNQFWKPVADKLKGIKIVYFSPDGVYNLFNPNTLRNPVTGKYVLDEIDLRMVTNTKDLVENKSYNSNTGTNIADLFGDPKFNLKGETPVPIIKDKPVQADDNYLSGALLKLANKGITPLPGTKIEVEKVSSDFKDKNWDVNSYLGSSALEENVKAVKNPRILHIATHGIFLKDVETMKTVTGIDEDRAYNENPLLRSMLLFAGAENNLSYPNENPADKDDGILTAFEAMNLDLDNTELVVLSACETGLGEVKNGEGVYGMQRAFQVAGAKAIIMSLWTVNDKETQELMTSFYDKWLSGMSKRQAFRKAQLELKAKYSDFYHWGSFIMLGE